VFRLTRVRDFPRVQDWRVSDSCVLLSSTENTDCLYCMWEHKSNVYEVQRLENYWHGWQRWDVS